MWIPHNSTPKHNHLAGMELPQHTNFTDKVQPLNEKKWADFQARKRVLGIASTQTPWQKTPLRPFGQLCKLGTLRMLLNGISFTNGLYNFIRWLWTIAWLPTLEYASWVLKNFLVNEPPSEASTWALISSWVGEGATEDEGWPKQTVLPLTLSTIKAIKNIFE